MTDHITELAGIKFEDVEGYDLTDRRRMKNGEWFPVQVVVKTKTDVIEMSIEVGNLFISEWRLWQKAQEITDAKS